MADFFTVAFLTGTVFFAAFFRATFFASACSSAALSFRPLQTPALLRGSDDPLDALGADPALLPCADGARLRIRSVRYPDLPTCPAMREWSNSMRQRRWMRIVFSACWLLPCYR